MNIDIVITDSKHPLVAPVRHWARVQRGTRFERDGGMYVGAGGGGVRRLHGADGNGAIGAAIGAGVGAKVFSSFEEAFHGLKPLREEKPESSKSESYQQAYLQWRKHFEA